jgi:hypothetical protein
VEKYSNLLDMEHLEIITKIIICLVVLIINSRLEHQFGDIFILKATTEEIPQIMNPEFHLNLQLM